MFDAEFWARWFGIVVADLLLAGDNALVIALAVRLLPKREQMLGRIWGTVGAVGLRLLFIALLSWLESIPLMRAAGGAVLLWVAWKLLEPKPHGPVDPAGLGEDGSKLRAGHSLYEAIKVIIVADVSMSLDNVFAITGIAKGDMLLVVSGIILTIPLVVFGSAILSKILEHFPMLVWFGGGLLGYVSGGLFLEDAEFQRWFGLGSHSPWHPVPVGLAVFFTALGWWNSRRARALSPPAAAG